MIRATIKLVLLLVLFPIVWTFGALYLLLMLMKGLYASFTSK